ncbi:MAG TPA: lipoprotein-releasing system ATP-binding protein LolD, partial [Idiomarina abyssalis]|nr:lipoprotein-releasing system ATP-binding protein LolD [Idiomarina abyssalis]
MTDALLRCSKLSKSYQDGNNEVTVLKDIDF